MAAGVRREGESLVFTGDLVRSACAGLWRQLLAQHDGAHVFDLRAVGSIDSAGLALLAEVAARSDRPEVIGQPAGLAELRAAYRLDAQLRYAA